MSVKVIVCGGRDFNDYERLRQELDRQLPQFGTDITIVSGHAKGADQLGERYANEHGLNLEVYPADWEKNGKMAGFMRNSVMAEVGNVCIAFWDGHSKGTLDMIGKAEDKNMRIIICPYISAHSNRRYGADGSIKG